MATTTPSEQSILPPDTPERFGQLCLALFRAVWQDASAQQKPAHQPLGVDIVGVNHAQDGGTWGVQCVTNPDGQSITVAQINQQLVQADQYRPKLSSLIIATNSLADGRVIQHCKISTNERVAQGLFPVAVLDWGQLQDLLRDNPHVAKLFYPDQFPTPVHWPAVPLVADFFDPANTLPLLKQRLAENGSVVAQGVSGVGKTQLALKYCHDELNNYAGVWWFQADTASTLLQGCILFCHRQGIPLPDNANAAQALHTWLEDQVKRQARWLLVFDNVQDVKTARAVLPRLGSHHVLLTSQIANWPGLSNVRLRGWPVAVATTQVIKQLLPPPATTLGTIATEVGSALVALRINLAGTPQEREKWDNALIEQERAKQEELNTTTKKTSGELLHRFGEFPLPIAISLFIGHRKHRNIGLTTAQAIESNLVKAGAPTPLGFAFSEAYAALSSTAQTLLGLLGWLAAAPLPTMLFTKHSAAAPVLSMMGADDAQREANITELMKCALCTTQKLHFADYKDAANQTFSALVTHELILQAARTTKIGMHSGSNALLLLQSAFPFDADTPENSLQCRILLPHAEAVCSHYSTEWNQPAPLGRLLLQMANYVKTAQGLYSQALQLEKQACQVLEDAFGAGNTITLLAMTSLADTLTQLGDLTAARAIQEKVLYNRPQDDPQTQSALSSFASTLQVMNDLPAARKMEEQVLASRIREFGETHPQTLATMSNLARIAWQMGDLAGARTLQEQALPIATRILGEEHPQAITLLTHLANTVLQMGDFAGARTLHEKALAITSRTAGADHPSTAQCMINLAETMAQGGELRPACALLEKALAISARNFGPSHAMVFQIKENLANYLEQDGAISAAQVLRNEVLTLRRAQNSGGHSAAPSQNFVLMRHEETSGTIDLEQFRAWHRTQLQTITLREFRCFETLHIDLAESLTVFIAPNGAGKTTILDAIALLLGQFVQCFQNGSAPPLRKSDARLVPTNLAQDIGTMEPRYPLYLQAQGEIDGKPFAWQLLQASVNAKPQGGGEKPVAALGETMQYALGQDHPVVLPLVAYYGTNRMQRRADAPSGMAGIAQFESGFFSRTAGYKDCLDSAADYREFEKWFAYAASVNEGLAERMPPANSSVPNTGEAGFAPLIAAVCQAVDACLATSGWKNLRLNRKSRQLVMQHPQYGELPIHQLSDGVRNMVALVADIAQRAVRLNPQFGEEAARKTPGLVLIDEVDLHLHPEWQQTVLTDLLAAFPMLQFVVTTHSPQVLTTVTPESIRQIEWDGNSAHLQQPEFSLGAESPQLLQALQGVNPRPQQVPIVKKLNRYLQLISQDQWDGEEATALRTELDEWGHDDEPSLTRADIDIRLREFRRGRA